VSHKTWGIIALNNTSVRAIAQAVSRQPPIAAAQDQSQVSSCGICGGYKGTEAVFFNISDSSASSHSTKCSLSSYEKEHQNGTVQFFDGYSCAQFFFGSFI
jgi:hypothetical protein